MTDDSEYPQNLGSSSMAYDKTLEQLGQQLAAFGVVSYEIQPMPPKGNTHLPRERIRKLSAQQVVTSLPWMKAKNWQGYDVFIRPSPPSEDTAHPLVFVDDIDQATVDLMATEGLPFAVLIESSAARFHGWIRIADEPLDRAEVSAAGRVLAQRYGADPASTDWRHYGRVAGTTNQKPSRATSRGAPFVMLRATSAFVAPAGDEVLGMARQMVDSDQRDAARRHQGARSRASLIKAGHHSVDALTAFLEAWQAATPARADDRSARDFAAAMSLLRRGYSLAEVTDAIRGGSPDLEARGHVNIERYVERTAENANQRILSTPTF